MKPIIETFNGRSFGKAQCAFPVSGGIVNETHIVKTEEDSFVLQKKARGLGGPTPEEYALLEAGLRDRSVPIPRILDSWDDEDGAWRIFERITHETVESPSLFRSLASAYHLRKTHDALADLDWTPREPIPGFHDAAAIFRKLERLAQDETNGNLRKLTDRVFQEKGRVPFVQSKSQLIHGDPKRNNFLFRSASMKSPDQIWLIDWDTLMVGSPLLDFGDFSRSFCRAKDGTFDADRFRLSYLAYSLKDARFADWEALHATRLITLELAARFLIDWFEDSYFGWDPNKFGSRKESNLASADTYLRYYRTIPEGI